MASRANIGEKLETISVLVRTRVLDSDGYTFEPGFREDWNKDEIRYIPTKPVSDRLIPRALRICHQAWP